MKEKKQNLDLAFGNPCAGCLLKRKLNESVYLLRSKVSRANKSIK